jgi:hypothetical protein
MVLTIVLFLIQNSLYHECEDPGGSSVSNSNSCRHNWCKNSEDNTVLCLACSYWLLSTSALCEFVTSWGFFLFPSSGNDVWDRAITETVLSSDQTSYLGHRLATVMGVNCSLDPKVLCINELS